MTRRAWRWTPRATCSSPTTATNGWWRSRRAAARRQRWAPAPGLAPTAVAVDAAGDVFIADTHNSRVVEVPAGGGPQITVVGAGSLYTFPLGVAVDVPAVKVSSGAAVSLRATVQTSPVGDVPSGAATFLDGSTVLGSAPLSGSFPAAATLSTTALGVGVHHITASYGGDSNDHASSPSAPITVDVVPALSTTTLTASAQAVRVRGSPGTLTATVAPTPGAIPTPTGSVTFKAGSATLASVTLSAGVATLAASALSSGVQSLTAAYGGDSVYPASSASLVLSVFSPGQLLVAGFRFQGTNGAGDGYVEHWSTIPAAAMSLASWSLAYPGGSVALPDVTLPGGGWYTVAEPGYSLAPAADDSPAGFTIPYNSRGCRCCAGRCHSDAVGFAAAPAAYRGGAGLYGGDDAG